MPAGTELQIEQAEIVAGPFRDTGGMCKLCPECGPCTPPDDDDTRSGGTGPALRGNTGCASNNAAAGAVCDTYCATVLHAGLGKALRDEPCFPHQNYKGERAHETPDRFIGDFNNANQTNVYIVGLGDKAETYTPRFAGGGLRSVLF